MESVETTFATVTIQQEIPEQRVRDLLCSAWEGGSSYWCRMIRKDCTPEATAAIHAAKQAGYVYAHELPFFPGCTVVLEETNDDPVDEQWFLTREKLIAGLQVMANKYPRHFADFLAENDDAGTADVYLQCCLFGEIVYG